MEITFSPRAFYPAELKLLKKLVAQNEKKAKRKIKFSHLIIAGGIAIGCAYIAVNITESFWTFLFGTISIFALAFIMFVPYEIYKLTKEYKIVLNQLNTIIDKGVVHTCRISAQRIAIASEYEDESDLYIIELNKNEVLYLWDIGYNLNKKFPCSDFEIYENTFFDCTNMRIYPLSDKTKPIKIDKKAKWDYMKKFGAPGNLEIRKIAFDETLKIS
ncbi:MAG: hypothetical protein REI96_04500 [Flavobacterium nitrogenifigens]|uniref:hypothetical protein n=1 Tax=Flavobacterium nitrogenifigens TaxID=1617283 RepID=UPI002808F27B|nr:hypothetical protein [Flavobacterium nitrogenifigens]MDQ8011684.1 hypothetical protein [Flavobacterium nitrogenifigens]